ncbi:LysR family transcriptional regulator [Nitrospirillum sp. BR 11828]|uniref:LysR family transcriptional regulator n=1 Tax=Nitrospirillum sp. BR 11828 TaxID=3104325 RepID=UPI002ACAA13B|nr:LysR family transcriptional regulator [Nitrospirillum sp. BR 11828]MDZ5649963.1 LysR family transcriptional regulator [Nitrospirillum sp. BR 11828]
MDSLRRSNLNQFYALDAILNTTSITEAAARMHISQPAMSLALKKLRDHFGDELVVYNNGQRQVTALAQALRPRVRHLLREAENVFGTTLSFDPKVDQRTVRIAAPDMVEITFLPNVIRRIQQEAPGVDIHFVPFDYVQADVLLERNVDLVIVPQHLESSQLPKVHLFYESLSCMVWSESSFTGHEISLEAYLNGKHAALLSEMEIPSPPGSEAFDYLDRRHVSIRTARYAMLPIAVIGTDLIVTTIGRFAQQFATMLPLKVVTTPFKAEYISISMQWPAHREAEPFMRWLTSLIHDEAARFPLHKLG